MSESMTTGKVAKKDSFICLDADATLRASQRLAGNEKDDEYSVLRIEFSSGDRWITITYKNDETRDEEETLSIPSEHAFKMSTLLHELATREKIFTPIESIEGFAAAVPPSTLKRSRPRRKNA